MFERIYLNRGWLFKANGKEEIVNIPHNVADIPYNYANEDDYQFVSTYECKLSVPLAYKNKFLLLNFEGVAHKSKLYINDKLVGEHIGGYDAFKYEISSFINYGKDNKIVVEVDSTEDPNIPPFGNVVDYMTYGGIYRDVYLDVCNDSYVNDVFVKPIHKGNKWSAQIEVELFNYSKYNLIISFEGKEVINKVIRPKGEKHFVEVDFDDPKLWDIDNPNMYDLKIELFTSERGVTDTYHTEFGLRTCEFKPDGFYLNDKKIKIVGLNRHQSYPYVGYAMPKSMQELDAEILKNELHVNAVRTSHYMQSQYFLSKCDHLGLLVFTESPGWQHIGDEKWKELVCKNVEAMVRQNRNHPSIILWGVRVNESVDDHDLYTKTNEIAHRLDSTRQTGGVRCYKKGEELEDVYTYNDFIDPNEDRGLSKKSDVVSSNIPYLVSEFNGHMHPTKMFDREDVRVEQARRLSRGMNEFYGDDEITGFFAWCMNDYNTHKDFGSGDRICYHGVLDMFRNPKVASYLYSSQGDEPYFELSSHLNIGDYDASVIGDVWAYTNADEVRLYRNGELIKTYTHDDTPFKNIPHTPILINDFVGNLLEVKEGYSKKSSDMMKEVLFATLKYGSKMPFKYKKMYLKLVLKEHITFEKGYELYGKYIGNWGTKEIVYSFEAVKNGEVFKTIDLGKVRSTHLEYKISSNTLVNGNSYDVALVRIKAVDQNGNVLPYYNEGFTVSTSGSIDLIGPNVLTFKGGYAGVYVKSNGKAGKGVLKISTYIENKEIEFEVK